MRRIPRLALVERQHLVFSVGSLSISLFPGFVNMLQPLATQIKIRYTVAYTDNR